MIRYIMTIIFLYSLCCQGQPYRIVKEIPTNDLIKANDDQNKICFKIYKDTIYQIRIINKFKDKYDLKITSFNIESGKLINCDTISGLPQSFNILDFVINNDQMLITGNENFIFFHLKNLENIFLYPENLDYKDDPYPFKYCENINDSLILLYTIYNYHPADAKAGVYLKIFNTNQKKFDKFKFMKFPSVGITHISGNWVTVIKKNIYIITPLTGQVYQLNSNLDLLNIFDADVFNQTTLDNNKIFESYIDSIIDNESARILAITNKYPKDSIRYHRSEYYSSIYSKAFISNTIHEVRDKHSYIDNIYNVDDSLMLLSVSQAGYSTKYRDLLFYDPLTNKIVKQYIKFPCVHADTISKLEDFFTINFSYGKPFFPFITHNYVYSPSFYSSESIQKDTYDNLSLKLFNSSKINGYKWTIYKFMLN